MPERKTLGRDDELAAVLAFLESQLPAALVLHGEPGIGKTTLFVEGLAAARERGFRVLVSAPAESETQLSFAALGDLLEGALQEVLSALPPPQQRALRVALVLEEARNRPPELRAVAAAVLGAVRALASTGPVLVAIDDVQWLDVESAAVLEYAIRRLEDEPAAFLLTVRTAGDGSGLLRIMSALAESRRNRIQLSSLSIGALHQLLSDRLGVSFPRPLLRRIYETSGGNPFFALELSRYLHRRGIRHMTTDALPIPDGLHELVRDRFEALADPVRETLPVVAATANPTRASLEAVLGRDVSAALDDAVSAGVLEVGPDRIRFTHPLLAASVYRTLSARERQRLHERLASVVSTPEERARHLALATEQPDREVAEAVEHTIADATARGGWAAAAKLAEHAYRLTPAEDSDDALRRLIEACELHSEAGDAGRALGLLRDRLATLPAGTSRARVLFTLARITASAQGIQPAAEIAEQALREARPDDRLQTELHTFLATNLRMMSGMNAAARHARRAVELAERLNDRRLAGNALAWLGLIEFNAGHGVPTETMARALALAGSPEEQPLGLAQFVHGHHLFWSGRLDAAREHFEALIEHCHRLELAECDALWYLSQIEFRAGDWDRAQQYAVELVELMNQLGREGSAADFMVPLATVTAHRGDVELAEAYADQVLALAETSGHRSAIVVQHGIRGSLALAQGRLRDAADEFARAGEILGPLQIGDPGMFTVLPDHAETLAALGDPDRAAAVLAPWAERARALDRAWSIAIACRCRGLICAARNDVDGALAAFTQALPRHEEAGDPFQLGRTLLALGSTERRANRRRAARETLQRSCEIFGQLGARIWEENARAELRRISGRSTGSDPLTPSEERIAALVAEGHTNREVAAALFLSVKTVESNLKAVYRKLGIRSRTELARMFATANVKDP